MSIVRCCVLALLAADFYVGASNAQGVRLPVRAHIGGVMKLESANHIGGLAKLTTTKPLMKLASGQNASITIQDLQNTEYTSQITVGGAQYTVLLDTGSSDLNVRGQVPNAEDSTVPIEVDFAVGSETGVMSFASVDMAGYTVPQQIFNHIPINNSTTDDGLLGLGPSSGSVLYQTAVQYVQENQLPANAGDSLLDRIFQQNTSTPNYMTFLLTRDPVDGDSGGPQGFFTIGDVIDTYSAVSKQPQLDVLSAADSSGQHWTVTLDGATGNDGKAITFPTSLVSGTASGKLVAVLDSGYTLPQVPKAITDAFYSSISGASLQDFSGDTLWTLPCTTEVNGAFIFAGQTYPVHPLDLNFDPTFVGLDLGGSTCLGAFQPMSDAAAEALDGMADMILGMAFLRNAYTLMNYGDFVDETADAKKPPFVQLLSTTNASSMAAEFAAARSGGASKGGNSGLSSSNSVLAIIKRYLGIIIAVPAGLILLGLVAFCYRRSRARRARTYRPLQAPAPAPYQPGSYAPAAYGTPAPSMRGYDDPFKTPGAGQSTNSIPLLERGDGGYGGYSQQPPYQPYNQQPYTQ